MYDFENKIHMKICRLSSITIAHFSQLSGYRPKNKVRPHLMCEILPYFCFMTSISRSTRWVQGGRKVRIDLHERLNIIRECTSIQRKRSTLTSCALDPRALTCFLIQPKHVEKPREPGLKPPHAKPFNI